MKFGMRFANSGPYVHGPDAVKLVCAAEEVGFDSVWTLEHVIVPPTSGSDYPGSRQAEATWKEHFEGRPPSMADETTYMPDPLLWMMYCAAHTSTIKFGSAMVVLPMRNPVLLAKEAATFDNLSNGRLLLGVSSGWLREEFEALGSNFGDRGKRMDDSIDLMRHLWGVQDAPRRGEFDLTGLNMEPKPVNGTIPIHIGGDSAVAARRAGTRGDGYFPSLELTAERLSTMRRAAEDAGRDPDSIEITVVMPDDEAKMEPLAAMGVKRVVVPVPGRHGVRGLANSPEELERWIPVIQKYADL